MQIIPVEQKEIVNTSFLMNTSTLCFSLSVSLSLRFCDHCLWTLIYFSPAIGCVVCNYCSEGVHHNFLILQLALCV